MANRTNIHGPGMVQGDRFTKDFIDAFNALEARIGSTENSVTNITNTVNNTVAGTSGDDLLAAMYGTNGIDIYGSIASGVEIRGSGASASSGFVPTLIADDDTFRVPLNTQALYHLPISIDGVLSIDGALVEV